MDDNIDIKQAADRLQAALSALEGALTPLVARVSELEKSQLEMGDFEADRAALARQLDESVAREKEFEDKEREFASLAEETQAELSRVISQVKQALGQGS